MQMKQNRCGSPVYSPKKKTCVILRSSSGLLFTLHLGAAVRRPTSPLEASTEAWWLVTAAAGGAVVRRGITEAWQAAGAARHGPAFVFVTAVAEAKHPVAIIIFRAAPDTAAIFSEHPHVEGRVAIVL